MAEVVDEVETEQMLSDDRRQYDRSRLIVDVHFDGRDTTGVTSTKDISLGGLYMNAQTVIAIGETLSLRINLGGREVVITGEVVYSNPGHGVGIRFFPLSEEARELMQRELPLP